MKFEFSALNKTGEGSDIDRLLAMTPDEEHDLKNRNDVTLNDEVGMSDLDQLLAVEAVDEPSRDDTEQSHSAEGTEINPLREGVVVQHEQIRDELSDLEQLLLFSAGEGGSLDDMPIIHTSDDVDESELAQNLVGAETVKVSSVKGTETSSDNELSKTNRRVPNNTDEKKSPFSVLSSAASLLKRTYADAKPDQAIKKMQAPEIMSGSLFAGTGNTLKLANTLAGVSTWKCQRIEKARDDVLKAAKALTSLPEVKAWQENLTRRADEQNCSVDEALSRLNSDESLSDLKKSMDEIWQAHPQKFATYQAAGDRFVKQIESIKEEFPNTDEQKKQRIIESLEAVENSAKGLPGYGDGVGDYQRISLAERIRNLVRIIMEFMQQLAAKLSGRKVTKFELTPN